MNRRIDWLSTSTEIHDHADFARFLTSLADDLRKNPADWERADLERYLRAMAYWTMNSMESVYKNIHGSDVPDPPTWRTFANIMIAGKFVED